MSVSLPISFNFRDNVGFVTDVSPAVYFRNADYAASPGYGWLNTDYPNGFADRDSGIDARLAGIFYVGGGSSKKEFRVDTGAGTFNIGLAVGDTGDHTDYRVEFFDGAGTTALLTVSGSAVLGYHWVDASGVDRNGAATWVSNSVKASITVASAYLRMVVGTGIGGAGDYTTVSHMSIAAAGGGVTVALTGAASTVSAGSLAPSRTVPITGIASTLSPGTVTVGSDVTVALTGIQATASPGSLTPSRVVPITGGATTLSVGTVAPSISKAISGIAATLGIGSVTPSRTVALTGQAVTATPGSVGIVGDVTVAITGIAMTVSAGNVSVPAAVSNIPVGGAGYPAPHGLMWKRKRIDQKVSDWVDEAALAYKELTEAKPEIQKRAAKIVRPFVKPAVKYALVPKVETIDFAAMRDDIARLNALFALLEQQQTPQDILDEDELFMLMVA